MNKTRKLSNSKAARISEKVKSRYLTNYPLVDLYYIFEKSNAMICIFSIPILNGIFEGHIGRKNPIPNRLKIQVVELDFSYLMFQT